MCVYLCVCGTVYVFVEGCRTEYLEELTVASLCSELLTAGEEGKQRERERERAREREKEERFLLGIIY